MKKIVVALLCSAGLALTAAAQQSVDETHTVSADATITVNSISGSIKVVGSDRADVRITGTLGRGIEKLEVTGSGSRLEIRVVYPHNCDNCGDANLELSVPAGSRPEVETVSADIDIAGVKGDARVESVSGDVTVETAGSISVQTVSGRLRVQGAGTRVDANTVSGDLELNLKSLAHGNLGTVSGDVRVDTDLAPSGWFKAESVSGSVELRLPASASADFDVKSFSGSIRNDFGPAASRIDEYGPGRGLRFLIGDGSARIYLESFSGDVRIIKK